MSPPEMAGWNLALRFALEVGALVSLGHAAWQSSGDAARWVAVVAVPVAAAAIWGVFNVVGDPSRSGEAPVEVPGWVRLVIEVAVLGGGAVALAVAGRSLLAVGFVLLVGLHYAVSRRRIEWLLAT